MQAVPRSAFAALVAAALALTALPAAATTYVPVADDRLLDRAAAVVEARVLAIESAPVSDPWPATDYLIEVSKVVAGEVLGRNLLVRLPGGSGPDGVVMALDGIPRFTVGERLLLFLTPGDDGTFRVLHWMLGAFRERQVAGRRVLLRDLAEAATMSWPGGPPAESLLVPRDAAAFSRWLSDTARGVEREADYLLPDLEVAANERMAAEFRLFESTRGFNMRWFEFDGGQDVDFFIDPGGQPGFGEAATAAAVRTAIGAWNGARGVNIRYRYAGIIHSGSSNFIRFANSDRRIDSSFDCGPRGGGVLAVGGALPGLFLRPGPNGKLYHELSNGRITTNAGIECFLNGLPNSLEQLLAHELGHTLGIHHPCGDGGKSCDVATELERDALMFPNIHNDPRGARLNEDDRAAARALYPGSGGGGGGPAPAAPSDLTAVALSATQVELAWSDNSNDETQFRIEGRAGSGPWLLVGTTGANATGTIVGNLQPATDYSFRVQARRGTTPSPFSDEAQATTPPEAPSAPSSFTGEATSATGVVLTWEDESNDEIGFLIEQRTPSSGAWVPVVTLPANTTSWQIEPLLTGVPHSFRVSALGPQAASPPTDPVSLTPLAPDAPCGGSEEVLCLQDRFRVTVDWNNPHGSGFGAGKGAAFDGGQSGTFWFFDPANVELIVKVLDGTALNDHIWVFHAALTDVEYWISVLDTQTGGSRTYYNPPLDRCGELDTAGIPGPEVAGSAVGSAVVLPNAARAAAGDDTACGDEDTLCLLGGRFEVEVDWVNQHNPGETGVGRRVAGSDQTGYFWFFDPSNIELVVKVLDARAIGQGFWVFYGSLSDVEFSLTVTDTEADEQKSYFNAPGQTCGQFDTSAFPVLAAPAVVD